MGSPGKLGGLFKALSKHDSELEEGPEWLEDESPPNLKNALEESSEEDLFNLTVSPVKPAAQSNKKASTSSKHSEDKTAGKAELRDEDGPKAVPPSSADGTKSKPSKQGPATHVKLKNPEKITFQRLLVEIPGGQSESLDLSGDAGAVGRLSSVGAAGSDDVSMLLDLKGVVYVAHILPMPCTACVATVGQSEGKVEAYFNEFAQLEESSLFKDTEVLGEGNIDDWTGVDVDDLAEAEAKKPTPKAGKGAAKAALGASGKVVKVASKAGKKGKATTARKGQGGKAKSKATGRKGK